MACYDVDSCKLQCVCKLHTRSIQCSQHGEEAIAELMDYSRPKKDTYYDVTEALECDIWFEPVMVWEILVDPSFIKLSKDSSAAMHKNGCSTYGVGFEANEEDTALQLEFVKVIHQCDPEEAYTSNALLQLYITESEAEGHR